MQNRLTAACEACGLAPDEIARRAAVSVYDLAAYMDGIRVPSAKTANRIGAVVGKTGAELVIGPPTTIADRMKTVRFDQDYTLEEMGEALGIASATVCKYEATGSPQLVIAITYAETFGVSLDWLLLGKGEPYA